jgi:hypothetical protein
MACECANYLHCNTTISSEDVVIPFVTCANTSIQIGVVYLIADSYPNVALLSKELHLFDAKDRREINSWMISIAALAKRCDY